MTRNHGTALRRCWRSVAELLRRRRAWLPAALLTAVWLLPAAAQAPAPSDQLQAAFVYNFAKFTRWPASRLEGGQSLLIGIAGSASVRDSLAAAAQGRQVDGHALEVVLLESPAAARGVHLLYVGAAEDPRVESWLAAAAGSSVLTVGETEAFARAGGMITFQHVRDKLRFDINMHSAGRAALAIDAQLQGLARSVTRDP